MSTLAIEIEEVYAVQVQVTEDTLIVDMDDGRSVSVPIVWYPRLKYGTVEERAKWRLIGQGHGIHWEALDEDISVRNIIAGKKSGESQQSFQKWLDSRQADQ